MDENQQDQPLSSEELLRRAREGLGAEDATPAKPEDFKVESFPPAAPEPMDEKPAFTPEPEFTQPDFTVEDTDEPDFDPASYDAPTVDPQPPTDTSGWAPPPVESTPDPVWGASSPPPTGPAPVPAPSGRGGGISSKLWILAVVVIAGIAVFNFLDPSKTVDEIAVGDCMNVPEQDEFFEVDTIDCAELHDIEIFAVIDLSDVSAEFSSSSFYPGDDAVIGAAFESCLEPFESYVGQEYETSTLYMDVFTPTIEGWNEVDDRTINCFVFDVNADQSDLKQTTGSLRGANR